MSALTCLNLDNHSLADFPGISPAIPIHLSFGVSFFENFFKATSNSFCSSSVHSFSTVTSLFLSSALTTVGVATLVGSFSATLVPFEPLGFFWVRILVISIISLEQYCPPINPAIVFHLSLVPPGYLFKACVKSINSSLVHPTSFFFSSCLDFSASLISLSLFKLASLVSSIMILTLSNSSAVSSISVISLMSIVTSSSVSFF
mmetsp:Transcript_10567/g.12029  ORF Transcript_10567/g.12029 Transcript_10567/m.12029 type:complete len:203 (-) Transcript_10567:108-716(-)